MDLDDIEVECEMIVDQILKTAANGRKEHRDVVMKLMNTLHDMSERMVECIDVDDEIWNDAMKGDYSFDSEGVMS